MKRTLVSLISDQTIPNILAIYHFRPDELLFISTEEMERRGKVKAIETTSRMLGLDFPDEVLGKLIVREDSLLDCHRQLENWVSGREDSEFIVNLTCGTKIMSIAVYEFFKDYGSQMIYIPIPKNEFITPFPKKALSRSEPLALRLSVPHYLAAYGLKVTNLPKLEKSKQEALERAADAAYVVEKYDYLKPLLQVLGDRLRRHRDEREHELSVGYEMVTDCDREFFSRMGMRYEGGIVSKKLSRSEIGFLTGGWLEEYCFNQIVGILGVDDVSIGLKLMNKQGGDNEFDVMFTSNNTLYFIECKSLDQNDDKKTDALYKIGALQKEFGLRVRSFLVTTSPHVLKDGRLRPAVRSRAEQFNTMVLLRNDVAMLSEKISERLNRSEV